MGKNPIKMPPRSFCAIHVTIKTLKNWNQKVFYNAPGETFKGKAAKTT